MITLDKTLPIGYSTEVVARNLALGSFGGESQNSGQPRKLYKSFRIRTSRTHVRKTFIINTSEAAQICIKTNDFKLPGMNTCEQPIVLQKTKDFKSHLLIHFQEFCRNSFIIRTYKKQGGGGLPRRAIRNAKLQA
jgi:hypothetical protein